MGGDQQAPAGPRLVALRVQGAGAMAEAIAGVWADGDAALPLDAGLSDAAVAAALATLRPHVLRTPDGDLPVAGALPCPPDLALVIRTSGSTGAPKGVELTHAALRHSAGASLRRLGSSTGDRWLCCLPLSHVAGVLVLVRSALLGAPATILDRFDTEAVARAEATHVSLVPTQLGRLLDARVDVRRFARILLGGAAATPELLAAARAAGATVVTTYGMTETCGGCVYDGVPLDGVEVSLDPAGRIRVRGPVLFAGYRAAQGGPGPFEWFTTPDRGVLHHGRLEVLGRADDVIVTGGHNVSGSAVAEILRRHPGVADVAVAGRPDPEWGQRVVAWCVPADPQAPPTLEELRKHVRAHAQPEDAPRQLVLTDELPRTALGKVKLAELRP